MQVNLNPYVNQSKPNFKAKFINNKETKIALETMAQEDPVATLALFLNMKDNEKGPNLALISYDDRYYGPYDSDKPVWRFKLYDPKIQEDWRYIKNVGYGRPETVLREYNQTTYGPSASYYYEEAKKILEFLVNDTEKYKLKSRAIERLASKKEKLKTMLSGVETKLAAAKESLNNHVAKDVVKKIL